MKTMNIKKTSKKINKKKDKKIFHSVTEVEKEFFPTSVEERKKRISNNIEKKTGSKLMAEILSSFLN